MLMMMVMMMMETRCGDRILRWGSDRDADECYGAAVAEDAADDDEGDG